MNNNNWDLYPNVKKALRVFESCNFYNQKLVALNYAKRAIEVDVKPLGKKEIDQHNCMVEKQSLYNFFSSLVDPGGLEV